jgi:NH3-dependent NAD+ synthetase
MNRIENYSELETCIVSWMINYAELFNITSFVIGVSGGIVSAVSSSLAAKSAFSCVSSWSFFCNESLN